MKPRELACEQINEKFGLNISCSWAVDDNASPNLSDYMAELNTTTYGGENVGNDNNAA